MLRMIGANHGRLRANWAAAEWSYTHVQALGNYWRVVPW